MQGIRPRLRLVSARRKNRASRIYLRQKPSGSFERRQRLYGRRRLVLLGAHELVVLQRGRNLERPQGRMSVVFGA